MNALTLKSIQPMLTEILFGDTTDEHMQNVVPQQGNLRNPSQLVNASAYFTYYISMQRRALLNRNWGLEHVATLLYTLNLRCIGINAETYMQSTLFWDDRTDVRKILASYDSQLLNTPREIIAVPYFQDGVNNQLSYNTEIKLVSLITNSEDEATAQRWKQIILEGDLLNRNNEEM